MPQRKEVLVLGAGFSAAAKGLPVTSQLSSHLGTKISEDSTLRGVFDSIPKSIRENFELLMSYLFEKYPWIETFNDHLAKALYHKVLDSIGPLLSPDGKTYTNWGPSAEWLGKFVEHIKNSGASIVTFNYDTILESEMLRSYPSYSGKERFFYPVPIANAESTTGISVIGGLETPNFKLIKLHGSVNWYWNPEAALAAPIYCLAQKSSPFCVQGLKQFIIPPLNQKSNFYRHSVVQDLWRQAWKLLNDTETIVFIGYSFPDTDLATKLFFQTLPNISKLKAIIVCRDSQVDAYKKRVLSVGFESSNCKFDYLVGEGNPIDEYFGKEM